jgi:hypothetical protein
MSDFIEPLRSIRISRIFFMCFLLAAFVAVQPAAAVSLPMTSDDGPALAVFNGQLFISFLGRDRNHHINFSASADGINFGDTVPFGSNSSDVGPAIAAYNGKMYVAWSGRGNQHLNIASSTDGLHFTNQSILPGNMFSARHPALAAANGRLYLAWLGREANMPTYLTYTTDGLNFVPFVQVAANTAWPPSLTASDDGTTLWVGETIVMSQLDAPPILRLVAATWPFSVPAFQCHTSSTQAGMQMGLGSLPGELLMAWISSDNLMVDVNGGSCIAGGISLTGFGTSGVPPAIVGFNGHAYLAFTGTNNNQNINIIQVN